jgi:ROK family
MPRKAIAASTLDATSTPIPHGYLNLPLVTVNGYSLKLRQGETFIGDSVSRIGFRHTLDTWRDLFAEMDGRDPLGRRLTRSFSKARLDEMLQGKGRAAATINAAIEDYSRQLAYVVTRFMAEPSWEGVERIVIGGGFQQSGVGTRAVARTAELLAAEKIHVQLQHLHHHPDEGGLIGWVHLAPPELLTQYDALLAVDIGGTNIRCGIVRTRTEKALDLSRVDVLGRNKWGHAEDDDAQKREDLIRGIADMLDTLIRKAKKRGISLAPFVGVACPGIIRKDGSISAGAQNLPGNWESSRFHLPRELCKRLPHINHQRTQVWLHNDAVVQGLSELPFMQDAKRWAALTIGTGLGNASYINRSATGR